MLNAKVLSGEFHQNLTNEKSTLVVAIWRHYATMS